MRWIIQALSEQKVFGPLVDPEADARRGQLSIYLGEFAFQQRDDVLLVEALKNHYLVNAVDESGAQQVINLFHHHQVLPRHLLGAALTVNKEANSSAHQLISLLLRQVAGQDNESVAEGKHTAERVEDAAVNRRRKIITEDQWRLLNLLEHQNGERRRVERRGYLRQQASCRQLFI